MALTAADKDTVEAIIAMVRAWPAAQRLSLVQEVLAPLAPEVARPREAGRHSRLRQAACDRRGGTI
jgi:hypothetical protein